MEGENEYDIERARDAVQMIQTIQSMIDVSADRLKGLRTQCLTSAELTQHEIRTLEGKLLKHFSRQLVIKARFGEELQRELGDVPCLEQWLRVVGLGLESIESVCSRVPSLEALRERSDHELRALMPDSRDEEVRRLCRAMHRLRVYTDTLGRGEAGADLQLYWDSWERRASPRPRPRASVPDDHTTRNKSPGGSSDALLSPRSAISKSRSHEAHLAPDSELSDASQSTVGVGADSPPPAGDIHKNKHNNHVHRNNHTAPSWPPVTRHDIAHRFGRHFSVLASCDLCDKQILFGSGLKCRECKFKCHRDCESKVPPSCGLRPEFVKAFRDKFSKESMMYVRSGAGLLGALSQPARRRNHHQPARDSSSATSSCNSSAPNSPALLPQPQPRHFNFPQLTPVTSSPNHFNSDLPGVRLNNHSERPRPLPEDEPLSGSIKSEETSLSLSGSGGGDSERLDLRDKTDGRSWPRQNSLSMKEWDIPYDELKLFEVLGTGRFGTVYRGSWHGAVAVKILHVPDPKRLPHTDTFRHEVATFRKTRHENLVLFMGACMRPPNLAIVTSLCKGMTLHTLIHLRRDKFTPNKSVIVAQQISQGMGYLHARGIIHKDLKTKNIFLENGKVVITDFGLFSVTKMCFANNARGDSLGIPAGWLCYLAPELVRALRPHASVTLPFSKASDVYAFGTVWYELLCGEWPFQGQPAEAVIWQVGGGVKQSLAALHAARDIKDILMTCWSFKPSERPDFTSLLTTVQKLPRKRLARSPSHPVHLSRSADSVL